MNRPLAIPTEAALRWRYHHSVGQPGQVYLEEDDGVRPYLYANRLQLGTLTTRIGLGETLRPPSVILLEHLPDRLRLLELEYGGPSAVAARELFSRRLDPTGELASPVLP